MTADRARAWTVGLGSRRRRGALVAAGVAAFGISVAGDTAACSPTDPSICGPDPTFSAAIVLALAAVLLVWWWPLEAAGCALAFALLDLGFDDVLAANVAWSLLAVLHVWHVLVLRREDAARRRALLDAYTAVPSVPPARDPGAALGPRHLAVGVLLAGSVACLWFLGVAQRAEADHQGRAVEVPATVVAVEDTDEESAYRLRLERPVPGVAQEQSVVTLDPYDVGETVPLRVDPADPGWTHLVAEPPDQTWWLSLSLGAFLLAVVLGRPLVTGRVRRGVLVAHPPTSGVPVRWVEVDDDVVPVLATDRDVVVAELATVGGPRPAGPDAPRLEHQVRTGWLVGDVREGGWCALVHAGGTELPAAPLIALPELPSIDDLSLDPELEDDVTAWSDPVPDHVARASLPATLTPTALDRVLGVAAVLAAPAVGVWMLGWEEASWWQGLGLSLTVVSVVVWGLTRLFSAARVDRDGLELTEAVWRHRVPMRVVAGVRVAGEDVLVLLPGDADEEGGLMLGPWVGAPGSADRAGPSAESVAAAIEDLRPVVRPTSADTEAVTRRLAPGAAVLALVAVVLLVRYLTVFVL